MNCYSECNRLEKCKSIGINNQLANISHCHIMSQLFSILYTVFGLSVCLISRLKCEFSLKKHKVVSNNDYYVNLVTFTDDGVLKVASK